MIDFEQHLQQLERKQRWSRPIFQQLGDNPLIFQQQQLPQEQQRQSLQQRAQQLLEETEEERKQLLYMLLVLAAGNQLHTSLRRLDRQSSSNSSIF